MAVVGRDGAKLGRGVEKKGKTHGQGQQCGDYRGVEIGEGKEGRGNKCS